jgi:NAD(P)-dependent dehydrogenase (short-subunit alcohol dehydrogenase family)
MTKNIKKWALITGSQGGIGKALVTSFARNGYSVIACDIKPAMVEAASVVNLEVDLEKIVIDEHYAEQWQKEIINITAGQGISALINNAAVQILGHSAHITRSDWLMTMNVNLSAPFFMLQLFLESLRANCGAVVNISSIHGTQTKRNFVAYATSKGALSSLTQNLAVDLGDQVRVNAIEPAAVNTDMLKAGFIGKESQLTQLESYHPMNRLASPEEIANLAVYLCSEQASFIHGACIKASGGIHACLSDPD